MGCVQNFLFEVLSTLKNRKTKTSNDKPIEQDLTAKDHSMPLIVTTLTLGSRPRQRELQGCGPKGSPGIKPKGSSGVKPKGCPGVKAKGSPGVTSHTPGSVRKCERV